MKAYHQWETNRNRLNGFDGPQDTKTQNLNEGEEMNSHQRHMANVWKIRLVFNWLDKQEQPLYKLK